MRRVWAAVLDMVFIFIFFLLVNMALGVWGLLRGGFLLSGRGLAAFVFFYSFLFDFFAGGMTYGKQIMKLRVEHWGSFPKWKFALLHSAVKTISIFYIYLGIALLLCGNGGMPYDRLFGSRTAYQGREVQLFKCPARVKRVGAVFLDYLLLGFVYGVSISLLTAERIEAHMGLFLLAALLLFLGYSFVCDFFFKGVTVGKRVAGLRVGFLKPVSRLKFALLHTLCRNLAVLLNTISLLVYVCCRGIMPYDGWLNMYVEEEGEKE